MTCTILWPLGTSVSADQFPVFGGHDASRSGLPSTDVIESTEAS